MTTLQQLDRDWLNALSILRRATEGREVRHVWERSYPEFNSHSNHHRLVSVGSTNENEMLKLFISTKHDWKQLPEVERVEILTFAACAAHISQWAGVGIEDVLNGKRFPDALQQVCLRAGCWWENTPEIRERWRLIDFYQTVEQSPLGSFERASDRVVCRICHQPVATGAGAWVNAESGAMSKPAELEVIKYIGNVHEECARYAHRVLVPKIKAAKEALEHARQTEEIDR